jgi:hypothetical protein
MLVNLFLFNGRESLEKVRSGTRFYGSCMWTMNRFFIV